MVALRLIALSAYVRQSIELELLYVGEEQW